MAFNLSSPVAKLAFEMALRNQQAQDSSAPFDASSRSFVSQALATGNDQLAPFEDIYRQYVDPAEAQRRAQAAAFNEYLIGLPELLTASQKELSRSGGGSGGGSGDLDTTNLSSYESPADRLNRLLGGLTQPTAKPKSFITPEERNKITRSGMGSRVTARRM
jgi:hypothetical protein